MDDLVVDRDAQRVLERGQVAGHADERGDAASRADDVLGDGVELERRHAGPDGRADGVEHVADEPAGDGHAFDLGPALERHPSRPNAIVRPLGPRC